MKITFVRTPKPKPFAYPPRYYDPEKERWEHRKRELGLSDEKADFKTSLSSNWKRHNKQDTKRKKTAGISVLIYFLIVSILIYFIFFT